MDERGIKLTFYVWVYLRRPGLSSMQAEIFADPHRRGPAPIRRAVTLANVRWFRAMAQRAVRDGQPNGALRASHARAAARIVLQQARRDVLVNRLVTDALAAGTP